MNRKENLEKALRDVFQSQSMTLDQVMALVARVFNEKYAFNSNLLDADCLQTKTSQCSEVVCSGMFVYADGLISSKIIEGRQIKAVVGYVERNRALAVCLHEVRLPWSSDRLEVQTGNMVNGLKATRIILETAHQRHHTAEAAQWCYNYNQYGVQKGEAFLPSIDEWEKLFTNKTAINASLKALGVALLDGWYWSSIEYSYNHAWYFDIGNGYKFSHYKNNVSYAVRPVISIKL